MGMRGQAIAYQQALEAAQFELGDDLREHLRALVASDLLGGALFGQAMSTLDAVCAAAALVECADSLLSDLIHDAINEEGHSWEEVGAALGTSAAAADGRYWVEIGGRSRDDPVRIITHARAGGATLREIANLLNQRRIPSPRGARWHPTSVNRALTQRKA